MSNYRFDEVLAVHPTVLNIPFELNKENYSCSFQLTNKTDRTVAYYVRSAYALQLLMVYRVREDRYVGTILPRSTYSVTLTVTVKPTTEPLVGTQWIKIWAHVVNDGVEAEDITRENLFDLTKGARGSFRMPVVFYMVPEKNEKKNLFHRSINDEGHGTTSEGKGSESSIMRQLSNEISSIILFSDQEIKGAINGLNDSSNIGLGGFGTVYKCILHDTEVAIKILNPNSHQGKDEFFQEIAVLGQMRHPNLVKLIGACVPLNALVYEYLPHGSVEDCLTKNPMLLTWQIRTRIVYDICSALGFLHSIKPQPVVHGDLKPANVLLDSNFISKLADFGLCRFLPGGATSVAFLKMENIQGTDSYIDPDFLDTGKLTPGCDVYSFGITILRILTGERAAGVDRRVERAIRNNSLRKKFDSTAGKWPEDVAEFLAYMGLECCEPERKSSKLIKDISTGLRDILAKIHINDGVKAEDTRENLVGLTKGIRDKFALLALPSAANSFSAVPDKNEKGISLLVDDDNLLRRSINDKEGSESNLRRQSPNKIPSIVLYFEDEIKGATNDLSNSSKIGQERSWTFYKGNLHDTEVAIKMLDPLMDLGSGTKAFHHEMEVVGRMRHPNIVKLIGGCLKLRALVYEFPPNGSVEYCLKNNSMLLTWQMRTRIVYDVCSALTFSHSIKPKPVVHGNPNPSNIFLDANFISKVTGFGNCDFLSEGTTIVKSFQTSTAWYIDPDLLETGKVTTSCDVYSFGITILRILTGAPVARIARKVEKAIRRKSLMAIVDSTAGEWPEDVAEYLARMGLECCEPERRSSKLMEDMLTGLKDILAKIDT